MTDHYRSIAHPTEGLYKEKGSRFLSFAFPVSDVQEVNEKIEEIRKRHHDARHVCYAYALGADAEQNRANDDGEPSGTAGRPILGQIRSFRLSHVLVLVVRYFGGILLGTGGLIQAYKTAACEALSQAEIVEKTVDAHLKIRFDYSDQNQVTRILKEEDAQILKAQYEQHCQFMLGIRQSRAEALKQRLTKLETLELDE